MKYSLSILLLASLVAVASEIPPAAPVMPLPVFLKAGFSSVLEFDEAPTRVVLGDSQAFQVERLERSLVIRTIAPYATTNLFVYFKEMAPKLFVLTAAEDAEPTYFKKIDSPKPPAPAPAKVADVSSRGGSSGVVSARFDAKKDYLTVEVRLVAGPKGLLKPNWELIRLRHLANTIPPFKLWSERKEVQKDASIRARLVFAKPNVPRDLSNAVLIVPIEGQASPLVLSMRGGRK